MSETRRMFCVFLAALVVRWGLAIALFAGMGNDGLLGTDSRGFLQWVSDYAETVRAGTVHGLNWLGPNISLLPMPSWLWTANALLFGEHSALTSVLSQGVVDSATCVLVYAIASSLDPHYGLPAGIAAALNPTQAVMSNLYYTDTVFLFFVALALYSAIRWLFEPTWRPALLLGMGLGGAMLSRVLIAPWAGFLFLYLTAVLIFQRRFRRGHLLQLGTAILIAGICTAPIVARNRTEAGIWTLTTQTAPHAAFWVVPLVMQARDGTPWERGAEQIKRRLEATYGPDSDNQEENSRRQSQVASEALRELGIAAIAKAWLYGAAINIGAPAATIFPPLAQLPRTGFFATPGASMPEKIGNFLFQSDNKLYAWALLAGVVGVVAFRLVQARGVIAVLRQRRLFPITALLVSWVVYILLVSGPIASPKYRLPIEPVLMILTAAGYCALREKSRS